MCAVPCCLPHTQIQLCPVECAGLSHACEVDRAALTRVRDACGGSPRETDTEASASMAPWATPGAPGHALPRHNSGGALPAPLQAASPSGGSVCRRASAGGSGSNPGAPPRRMCPRAARLTFLSTEAGPAHPTAILASTGGRSDSERLQFLPGDRPCPQLPRLSCPTLETYNDTPCWNEACLHLPQGSRLSSPCLTGSDASKVFPVVGGCVFPPHHDTDSGSAGCVFQDGAPGGRPLVSTP